MKQGAGNDDRRIASSRPFPGGLIYRAFKRRFAGSATPIASRFYLRSRNFKRNLSGKRIRFVSVDQALAWTMEWIETFPRRYDLVVGIPRSGLFIASLVALKLGRPFATPETLVRGDVWQSRVMPERSRLDDDSEVLLVDDAINSGNSMRRAVELIRGTWPGVNIATGSLIVREESRALVDLYHRAVPPPRAYEWNIMHRKIAQQFGKGVLAVDMDGVLCPNCPREVDADEQRYVDWLREVPPFLVPEFEIDAIVTSRLERYRSITEDWLARHDVKYRELHMWDLDDKKRRLGKSVDFKVSRLLSIKPDLFWESSLGQSEKIWKTTRIPVLCIDEMTLFS